MNMETKNQVFDRYKDDYFKARTLEKGGREKQGEILDTVCEVTRIHRKSAVRKFGNLQTKDKLKEDGRGRPTLYTPDVTAALKEVWEASNGLCGELLHPVIDEYITAFEKDGSWKHSDEATEKLVHMKESTVKRRVAKFEKIKRKGQGFSSTSPSAIKTIIPIS